VAELFRAAFDALAGTDLAAVTDAELLALTGELVTAQNRLAAGHDSCHPRAAAAERDRTGGPQRGEPCCTRSNA
jgi:hypothetical protein